MVTDIDGNILFVKVHAANIHDTKAGQYVIGCALQKYPSIVGVCADAGYKGTFVEFARLLGLKVDISERTPPSEGSIIPKRWKVDHSLAWIGNSRRLSKDYGISTHSEETHVYISATAMLLRRLA